LINGRLDLPALLGNAWALHEVWPGSELVIVDGAGHAGDHEAVTRKLVRASNRFASGRSPGFGVPTGSGPTQTL